MELTFELIIEFDGKERGNISDEEYLALTEQIANSLDDAIAYQDKIYLDDILTENHPIKVTVKCGVTEQETSLVTM